jgi:hypothetical protein
MQQCPDIQIWAGQDGGFYKPVAVLPMADGDTTDEANARLIAAAPDLLAALLATLKAIDGLGCNRYDPVNGYKHEFTAIVRTARAALAKAEGKP